MTRILRCVLVLAAVLALPPGRVQAASPAPATTAAATTTTAKAASLTPAQAQQVLEVLQDPKKRAEFTTVLESMAKALPATAPAGPAALAPNGLGAELLTEAAHHLSVASQEFVDTAQAVADVPLLLYWFNHVTHDPTNQGRLLDAFWKLLVTAILAAAAEWGTIRLLRRFRRSLDAISLAQTPPQTPPQTPHETPPEAPPETPLETPLRAPPAADLPAAPQDAAEPPGEDERVLTLDSERAADAPPAVRPSHASLLRRVPYVLLRLLIDLVPVAVFAMVCYGVASTPLVNEPTTRLVLLAAVNAYLMTRIALCGARMMVSPNSPTLRLLHVSDGMARYIMRWTGRLAGMVFFGFALSEISADFGLYVGGQQALLKVVALVVHVMLVIVVLEIRGPVARRLRARHGKRGLLPLLRNRLAATWHLLAIFYIVALWFVWAFEVQNGYARLWHVFVSTVLVLAVARVVAIVVLGALERLLHVAPETAARFPEIEIRARRYQPALRAGLLALIFAAAFIALLEIWGLDSLDWFATGGIGGRVLSAATTIAVAGLIAVAVWEAFTALMDRKVASLTDQGLYARSARLRTLLPILRTGLLVCVLIVVGLTALSEIGVNIAPLLAGAGIVGVAIGFGSQKLVQDFITGIFLLLENAMQVGDQVTLGGLSGAVEALSIRTIRLRAGDGSVHIIPFSAVTTVTNLNRGAGNAAVSVNVAYDQDTDEASAALIAIAADLRHDPDYSAKITGDFALWGVDKVDGAMVTILGQIPCTDSGRWSVQREFNRRMKKRFQDLGIAIAVPIQRITVDEIARPDAAAMGDTATIAAPAPPQPRIAS